MNNKQIELAKKAEEMGKLATVSKAVYALIHAATENGMTIEEMSELVLSMAEHRVKKPPAIKA